MQSSKFNYRNCNFKFSLSSHCIIFLDNVRWGWCTNMTISLLNCLIKKDHNASYNNVNWETSLCLWCKLKTKQFYVCWHMGLKISSPGRVSPHVFIHPALLPMWVFLTFHAHTLEVPTSSSDASYLEVKRHFKGTGHHYQLKKNE